MAGHLGIGDLLDIVGDPNFIAPGGPTAAPPSPSADAGEATTLLDIVEQLEALGQGAQGDDLLADFYTWALGAGIQNPNPADVQQSNQFRAVLAAAQQEQSRGRGGGAAGRVQFESERVLQQEQAESLRQGRQLDLASFMENLKEMAFGRVKDKMELLQDVDTIRDARRAAAMSALSDFLPFIIPEGLDFFPGTEPGGVTDRLGGLLGVNVPNLKIPRVNLPLQELVDAPLAASPAAIESALGPLTGTVQQPRQVQLPAG